MAESVDAPVREATRGQVARRAVADRLAASGPLLGKVFALWLATRLGYLAVTYLATAMHLYEPGPGVPHGMIFSWERWDTNWYLIISRLGYIDKVSANFFPLYPAAMGWVSWLLGDGSGPIYPHPDRLRLLVGIGLSNVALLVGLYAVARLAEHDAAPGDERAGVRAAWILLAYPFAMAFTAPLAEAFFLAFAALSFLFARQGRWYAAVVPAFLAGLTRPFGVVLVAPLAWEYGRQHGWWRWPPSRPTLGALAQGAMVAGAAAVGTGIYLTYLYVRFGDFLLPLHDQLSLWNHVSMPPWKTAALVVHNLTSGVDTFLLPVETALVVSFALITLIGIRRTPFAYTLYMAGLLYLDTAAPLTIFPDLLNGTTRYLASAIPVFLILGRWSARRSWLETLLICAGMMVQGTVMVAIFQGKLSA
jgi:hypothetical protein